MDWEKYEETTKYIYETLGKQAGVEIVGWGNNFKVTGSSGIKHQIDVLTSHSDGIHTYLTDIECKYWEQKINKDIVMKVKSIVDDCKFSKGIVVSKSGFTEDAIMYAKAVGIGLVILRKPIDEDWEGRVRSISLEIKVMTPTILRFEQMATKIFIDMNGKNIRTEDYYYQFDDSNKKSVKVILDDFLSKINNSEPDKEIEETIKFPKEAILKNSSGVEIAIVAGVKIKGKLLCTVDESVVSGDDHVWLIMKSIFEEKVYAISEDGEIKDVTK